MKILGNSTAVKTYLDKVFSQYRTGRATEHTYRGDLANLIGYNCIKGENVKREVDSKRSLLC